jgi:hypothetical protein
MKHWDRNVGIQVRQIDDIGSATEATKGRGARLDLSVELDGREKKQCDLSKNAN